VPREGDAREREKVAESARISIRTTGGPWIAHYIDVEYMRLTRLPEELSMKTDSTFSRHVASHVLRALASEQLRGRVFRLDELALHIGVRREDVRSVVAQLHREGHVDAQRMRLTMSGLVLASAMRDCKLPPVRAARTPAHVSCVA
jgi:hypothetical protein